MLGAVDVVDNRGRALSCVSMCDRDCSLLATINGRRFAPSKLHQYLERGDHWRPIAIGFSLRSPNTSNEEVPLELKLCVTINYPIPPSAAPTSSACANATEEHDQDKGKMRITSTLHDGELKVAAKRRLFFDDARSRGCFSIFSSNR